MFDQDNLVYASGTNDRCQLGIKLNTKNEPFSQIENFRNFEENDIYSPKKLNFNNGIFLFNISAGVNHCLASGVENSKYRFFSWGDNTHGQLGIGNDQIRQSHFNKILEINDIPIYKVILILFIRWVVELFILLYVQVQPKQNGLKALKLL